MTDATSTDINAARTVKTGKCRASYVNVFKPRLNEQNGQMEYSMCLLVPKSDTVTMNKIKAAAKAAIEDKWGSKPPKGLAMPWHDGDGAKPNGGEYGEECHGHYVINLKSKDLPGVVDQNTQPLTDPTSFVSGDYCRITMRAFGYDNKRIGVSFGLNNIQLWAKGEPLSGRKAAKDEFDSLEGEDTMSEGAGNQPWD
jgi:hypothetical protein